MHDGVKIRLGDRELVMPKLTVGPIKRFWPTIQKLRKAASGTGEDAMDALPDLVGAQCALIHAALKRNYPDLTLEEVEDDMEMNDLPLYLVALFNASGFTQPGADAGEAERPLN